MTVHDDFLAELAAFRSAPAPEAGPELQALFSSVAAVAPSPSVDHARSVPVPNRSFTGLASKIAAGALGALLAGTVAAGALTGTMALTSDHDDDAPCVVPVVHDEPGVEADEQSDVADEAADDADDACAPHDEAATDDDGSDEPDAADEADADEADDASMDDAAPVDLASVPVPTTQSEAAHTHAFDEACGNHGAYVSAFAHTGEAPECATSPAEPAAADAPATTATDDATAEPAHGKSAGKASAKAAETTSSNGGKGKGRSGK